MTTKLLGQSKVIVKDGAFQVVHDKQRETDFKTLKVYKENGKVIISKKSKFLGVVELENEREIRKVATYLYKLISKDDKNR